MAEIDLSEPIDEQAVEKVIERLVLDGAIREDVAGSIGVGGVVGFFESDLGCEVLDPDNRVLREWQFSYAMGSSADKDDRVIVQGIIDMLVVRPEGLVVIDFKSASGFGKGTYEDQVRFYGRAAEGILKRQVVGKWLYYMGGAGAVEVD